MKRPLTSLFLVAAALPGCLPDDRLENCGRELTEECPGEPASSEDSGRESTADTASRGEEGE